MRDGAGLVCILSQYVDFLSLGLFLVIPCQLKSFLAKDSD